MSQHAYVAFCLLTSVIAFFISWLMDGDSIASFTIPAKRNDWDLQEKSGACRNAGFMYLLVALAITAKGFFGTPKDKSVETRVANYVHAFDKSEVAPLMSRTAGSDSDDDTAPAVQGGIPSGRFDSASAYGTVEMKVIHRTKAQRQ